MIHQHGKAGESAGRWGRSAHFHSNEWHGFSIKMLHLEWTLSHSPFWASAGKSPPSLRPQ